MHGARFKALAKPGEPMILECTHKQLRQTPENVLALADEQPRVKRSHCCLSTAPRRARDVTVSLFALCSEISPSRARISRRGKTALARVDPSRSEAASESISACTMHQSRNGSPLAG
jgi:hypothetical protein